MLGRCVGSMVGMSVKVGTGGVEGRCVGNMVGLSVTTGGAEGRCVGSIVGDGVITTDTEGRCVGNFVGLRPSPMPRLLLLLLFLSSRNDVVCVWASVP